MKWKNLIFTHSTKEIINLFNSIFLGIYFFKITDGSVEIVALYYLIYYLTHILWRYLISKVVNSRRVVNLYRLSIFTNLIMSLTLIIMKQNIVRYIYYFGAIYALSQCLYWTNYEIIVNDLNKNNNFNKFFVYDSVLNSTSNIIFPIIFGNIIEKYSYIVVFSILCIISLIALTLSLKIKENDIKCNNINLQKFYRNVKNKKMLRLSTLQSISDGLTNGGVLQMLVTLVIFNKISSEAFIGSLSSIVGILCIIIAISAERKVNYKNYKKIVLPITIMTFLITIPISIKSTIVMIILYKVISDICDVLTNIEGNTITFNSLKYICDEIYKVDYFWHIELTLNIGRGIGLIAIIIVSKFTNNIKIFSLLFILFSAFFIIRTLIIIKLQREIVKEMERVYIENKLLCSK